jgi:oligoribonuclease
VNGDLWLWFDAETTGSDVEKDCIIEVGAVLTTPDLVVVGEFESLVEPSDLGLGRLMKHSVVRPMHEENGLLDAILNPDPDFGPPKIHTVTRNLLDWIDKVALESEMLVLAGSGVGHFDRRFIDRYMPQLAARLRYWAIDVGVLRRAHEAWVAGPPVWQADGAKAHRGLADAWAHLAEAKAYRDHWRSTL